MKAEGVEIEVRKKMYRTNGRALAMNEAEGQLEVHLGLEVAFHDVLLLFGEFLQRELVAQREGRSLLRRGDGPAFVREVQVELLFLQLVVDVQSDAHIRR